MNTSSHKHIEVVPYNPSWPEIFQLEANLLRRALGNNLVEIHHIGSTSVPGLSSKPFIDILAVVKHLPEPLSLQEKLYTFKGELNIPMRHYLTKEVGSQKVNLNLVETGNGFISLNLSFRDYLRAHKNTCLEYQKLKQELLSKSQSFQRMNGRFTGYNLGKNEFIKKVLEKAGFSEYVLNFSMHNEEWNTYHRIREEQIFAPINACYNRNHPTITAHGHYHFILYKGTQIVSVAHIEFLNNNEAALRSIATDTPYKRLGHGSYMMSLLENWVRNHNKKVMKLHAGLNAEGFYRKLGYIEMEFNDVSISKDIIDLGKIL